MASICIKYIESWKGEGKNSKSQNSENNMNPHNKFLNFPLVSIKTNFKMFQWETLYSKN